MTHPMYKEAVDFNNKLVEVADGLLPAVTSMKYISLGGGHTNSFLRCLNAGTKTTIEEWGEKLDKGT